MGLGGTGILGYMAGVEGAAHPNLESCFRGVISRSPHCRLRCAILRPSRTRCCIPLDQNDMILSRILVLYLSTKVNYALRATDTKCVGTPNIHDGVKHREHLQTGFSLTLFMCHRACCNELTGWVEMGLGWAARVWGLWPGLTIKYNNCFELIGCLRISADFRKGVLEYFPTFFLLCIQLNLTKTIY